jgi:hypothetical protein
MTAPFSSMIEDILFKDGPMLSSALCKRLEGMGLSSDVARQRVSRARGKVRRLSTLTFPKNTFILYHETTHNSADYWDTVVRITSAESPAYGPALAAILRRDGIVPESQFCIISGAPEKQRGQTPSSLLLARLISSGLLKRVAIEGIGSCVALDANGHFQHASPARLRARLLTENIMILAVRDWARKLGMASYEKIATRDGPVTPKYGTFHWDLCGPSYIRPMVKRIPGAKPNPGFLVCDVVAGNAIDEYAIAAFIRKCKTLSALRGLPPMMPMLLSDGFTREAFRAGRSHGIIMATPETLFGRDVASGLALLLQTVTKAADVVVERPEVIPELFGKLGEIEGAAGNLRGALFELIMGHAIHMNEGDPIEIGKIVTNHATGERREIDVLRIKERREAWVYEGKGNQPSEVISLTTVEEWVTKKVSVIYQALRVDPRFQNLKIGFEFWTCGSFSNDAHAYLKDVARKTKKYTIGFKDGADVRKYVAETKSSAILKTLDDHYFEHPLSRFDLKYDASAKRRAVEPAPKVELGDFLDCPSSEDSPLLLEDLTQDHQKEG